jgi:hypothetical protein
MRSRPRPPEGSVPTPHPGQKTSRRLRPLQRQGQRHRVHPGHEQPADQRTPQQTRLRPGHRRQQVRVLRQRATRPTHPHHDRDHGTDLRPRRRCRWSRVQRGRVRWWEK